MNRPATLVPRGHRVMPAALVAATVSLTAGVILFITGSILRAVARPRLYYNY